MLDEKPGRGARKPERDGAVGDGRLLRHARLEVGVGTVEALGRRTRDALDLRLERRVDAQAAAERARHHLHRAVVVRRAEPARHEARIRLDAFLQRGSELVGRVADDQDARRLESEP